MFLLNPRSDDGPALAYYPSSRSRETPLTTAVVSSALLPLSKFEVDALSPVRDGPSTGNDSSSVKDAGWSIPNSVYASPVSGAPEDVVSLRSGFLDGNSDAPDDGSTQYEDSDNDLSDTPIVAWTSMETGSTLADSLYADSVDTESPRDGTPLAAGALLEPCDQKTYRRTRRGRRAGKKHKNMSYESQRQIAEELEVLRLEADKLKAALDAGTLDEYDMDALGNLLASPYSSAAESSDEDSSPAPHRRRARRGAKILNDWDTESDLQTVGNPFAFSDAEAEASNLLDEVPATPVTECSGHPPRCGPGFYELQEVVEPVFEQDCDFRRRPALALMIAEDP
ncbi:hypothetical protein B0H21DRAFT_896566 [Amylocystis lapponica]|nr:hypothetical protein B0H21DRAFT_896566 [Amylocystis lapponica]